MQNVGNYSFVIDIIPLDLDECANGENGGCEQTCNNTYGSYHCDCLTGYMLDEDEMGCSGISSQRLLKFHKNH